MTIPAEQMRTRESENFGSSLSSIENGSSATLLSSKAIMPDSSTGLDLQDVDLVDADEIALTTSTGGSFQ